MPLFRQTLLALILLELLSLLAWLYPVLNTVCFFVILILILLLSLKNLATGLLIALGELIIGSYGYLFSLNLGAGSTIISLRLGIFMIVLLAFAFSLVRQGFKNYWQSLRSFRFFQYYLWLAVALIWGFVWGLIRGNGFGNTFLDFNNWLFFLYLLPLVSVKNDQRFWPALKMVALACLSWLIFKTLFLFYIFAHQFVWALPEIYLWVRDTRVGEITRFSGSFYRVFLQSQIYALLGFFILLPLIKKIRINNYRLLMAVASLSVVFVSLSRSFWAGLLAGLAIYFVIISYELLVASCELLEKIKILTNHLFRLILVVTLSFALLFTVAYAPPAINGNLSQVLSNRMTEVEAAGSSRLSMLKPLLLATGRHPVVGSGFGATVTYKSLDPRVIPATAGGTGQFTTYAFEWGYLDLLLKIGLFGVFVYLLLIFKLLRALWQQFNFQITNPKSKINLNDKNSKPITSYLPAIANRACEALRAGELLVTSYSLPLGLLLATIALLVVNIFTPYLNHPLGIGFILVVSVWTNQSKNF